MDQILHHPKETENITLKIPRCDKCGPAQKVALLLFLFVFVAVCIIGGYLTITQLMMGTSSAVQQLGKWIAFLMVIPAGILSYQRCHSFKTKEDSRFSLYSKAFLN
jgi:hypothetical protein